MELSYHELQLRLFYSCVVAGKSANFAENVIDKLFPWAWRNCVKPFTLMERWLIDGTLMDRLIEAKTGNYIKMFLICSHLAAYKPDLQTCEIDELEAMYGVGPKTARFFMLWTRPDARYAALDVHILRWLRSRGYKAPKQTPQEPKKYAVLEKSFLQEADRMGMTPRQLDTKIWSAGVGRTWSPDNNISK